MLTIRFEFKSKCIDGLLNFLYFLTVKGHHIMRDVRGLTFNQFSSKVMIVLEREMIHFLQMAVWGFSSNLLAD